MIPRELFRKIRRIEIRTKGLVNHVFGGEYHSAFKGRGIEFSEVRPYQIGDDIRSIDWNVSARTGDTFVKVFEEEREQTLMLVVDVSGSGNFGSQSMFKREGAAEICAIVGFSAISNNDKVGLLLVSDRVELFVPPKKGRRHILRLLRDLFAHEPESRSTNLSAALHHLSHVLNRRSIVLLISDFMDDGFTKPLRIVARRHDTIAVHLLDPREQELPDMGLVDLIDAETGEAIVIDSGNPRMRTAFATRAQARQARIDDLFRRMRMDHVLIRMDESCVEPLIRFFRHRNRTA